MKADTTFRRLRLEIGRCVAELKGHVVLPDAPAYVSHATPNEAGLGPKDVLDHSRAVVPKEK